MDKVQWFKWLFIAGRLKSRVIKEMLYVGIITDEQSSLSAHELKVIAFLWAYKEIWPNCPICGKPVKYSNSFTFTEFCSRACVNKSAERKEAIRNGLIRRYGEHVTNSSQIPGATTKAKFARLQRYGDENYGLFGTERNKECMRQKIGVDNAQKNKEIRERTQQTNLERHGAHCNLIWQKEQIRQTMNNLYGGTGYGSKIISARAHQTSLKVHGNENFVNPQKAKQTFLKKYGVEHWAQDTDMYRRAMFKYKKLTLPSGKVINVQGYEPQIIIKLLETYKEEDLIVDNKEMAQYIGKLTYYYEGKLRRYWPDIYIKSENMIIEVKSK